MTSYKAELLFHPQLLNSQKVLLALLENDITFVPTEVNVFKGETFNDAFFAISPHAEVPVLKTDGKVYLTCAEIFEFLHEKKNLSENTVKDPPPNDTEKSITALLNKLDYDALFLGCLHHFQKLGLSPCHPYNSEVFRSRLKSMFVNQLPFLLNRKKTFPSYAESLDKRCKKLKQSISILSDVKRFNAHLNLLTEIFKTCDNELKSRDEAWLFSSDRIKPIDMHFGLLLHHLYELGFETSILWRKHPRVDLYYRRFIMLKNVKKVLNWSSEKGMTSWKVCFTGLVAIAFIYGVTRWMNTNTKTSVSKSYIVNETPIQNKFT